MKRPVVILGAGPAGIGAALALGHDATVLERGRQVAGLSRTLVHDGAVFDLAGHSFHTPHARVRDLVFDAVAMEEQRREAWCWTRGDWIAYPFQKHVADLRDPELRDACLAGMASATDARDAPHFDAYIDAHFGRAVAQAFMRPYNRKLWGEDLSRLTTSWAGERIAGPLNETGSFAETGGMRTPLQSDTKIAYPSRGGFGGIFEALASRLEDLRLDTEPVGIDTRDRSLTTRGSETFHWERLVSTVPLAELLALVSDVPPAIRSAVATLEAIAVDLVMVVLEGRGPTNRQRVYCPDADMPGHKIVLNHTSSAWLRDQPRHGIQVEISGARQCGTGSVEPVIDNLLMLGLINARSDVRCVERLRLPLGYPAPTHARDSIIQDARAWLLDQDIHICGRFSEWAYINSDEALARGLETARILATSRSSSQ